MAEDATPVSEETETEQPAEEVEAPVEETTFTVLDAEGLNALDDEALATYHADAVQVFDAEVLAATDLENIEALASTIEASTALSAARVEAAEAKAAKIAELSAAVHATIPETAEESAEVEQALDNSIPEGEEPAEAKTFTIAKQATPTKSDSLPANVEHVDVQPEAKRQPVLVASAAGVIQGDKPLDGERMTDLSAAASFAKSKLSTRFRFGATTDEPVMLFQHMRNYDDEFTLRNDSADEAKFKAVTKPLSRKELGSLVAAAVEGGETYQTQCGPVQEIMEFCDEEVTGLCTVPTLNLTNGCVTRRWDDTSIKDWIGALRESRTCDPCEAKPVFGVTCGEPREPVGICARPLIMEASNWTLMCDDGIWERNIARALTAHQVNVHLDTIEDMEQMFVSVEDLDTVTPGVYQDWTDHSVLGAGVSFFSALELYVKVLRQQLCYDAAINIKLPTWALCNIRQDMARVECCDVDAMGDQRMAQKFAQIGVQVEYINFYYDLDPASHVFPSQIPVIVNTSNGIIRQQKPQLNFGFNIRDSVLNEFNLVQGMVEDFYAHDFVCVRPQGVLLPACVTGARATNLEEACGAPALPYAAPEGEFPRPCDDGEKKAAVKTAE